MAQTSIADQEAEAMKGEEIQDRAQTIELPVLAKTIDQVKEVIEMRRGKTASPEVVQKVQKKTLKKFL
jgi:hypothetical protein